MNINATLFGQAIWFAVFIWITMKFVWPPLQKAMQERQKQIADGLAAAERGKHDLELAAKRSADVIREAKDMGNVFFGVVGGEPFMHPQLLDMLAAHPDCYFQVFTNGHFKPWRGTKVRIFFPVAE